MRLFSHVSVIYTVIQNVQLATNSQNAILNNFEEHYMNGLMLRPGPEITKLYYVINDRVRQLQSPELGRQP